MPDTLSRVIEEGAPATGVNHYKSGPWLIVHGHGLASEEWANDIARQCDERGVTYEMAMIDEITLRKDLLRSFHGLIIVLSTVDGPRRPSAVRRVVEFVKAYRATRTEGLTPLLDGSRRWFEVGVLQVVGDRAVDRELRSVAHMVDRYHTLRDGDTVDPFAAYASGDRLDPPGAQSGQPSFARSVSKLRANLHSWGIGWELTAIADVRQFIDGMRQVWESPAYSDLRRPVPGTERNRLDFLLDDPAYVPSAAVCTRKKWMEGGQRVVTRVLRELLARYPDMHRPSGREGARYKQREFQSLYQTLRTVEENLRREELRNS